MTTSDGPPKRHEAALNVSLGSALLPSIHPRTPIRSFIVIISPLFEEKSPLNLQILGSPASRRGFDCPHCSQQPPHDGQSALLPGKFFSYSSLLVAGYRAAGGWFLLYLDPWIPYVSRFSRSPPFSRRRDPGAEPPKSFNDFAFFGGVRGAQHLPYMPSMPQ